MSEHEPSIGINLGQTHFEMTRDNSFLYSFIGRAALFNHIWIKRDDLQPPEDSAMTQSTYLFENLTFTDPERAEQWARTYGLLVLRMTELDYPLFLNQKAPAECDINAYIATTSHGEDLDHVPEGWA